METFFVMLKNVIIFVLLAVPGYILVKGKTLNSRDSGILSKLLTNIGVPALILSNTVRLEFTGSLTKGLIVVGLLSVVFYLLMYVTSGWLCKGEKQRQKQAMTRFCMIFSNSGFIGIPLALAVFPGNGEILAYVSITNIVMNLVMFTLGAYLISGDKSVIQVKTALLSPVLLAFLGGLVLNLLGIARAVPEIDVFAGHLKGIVTPLSMFVMGMKLADVSLRQLFASGRMYYVSLVRLVVYPVVGMAMILLLRLIPALGISANGVLGYFIGFAMPVAGLSSVFTDRYQGDGEGAVIYTLGTTVLSVLTIPTIYWLLMLIL